MQGLENILNRLGAGFLLIDREHRIEWVNEKAKEWFGPLKIGERRKCYRTIAYSASFCEVCPTGKTMDSGIPTHYEFNLPKNSYIEKPKNAQEHKKPAAFEVIGIPVFDKNGSVSRVMELVFDVTEKVIEKIKSEELMAQIEKMAAVGQLAAGVAHELNTPIATISVISEELQCIVNEMMKDKNGKEELKEYLADIDGEIKRCKTIIDDLLNFSKKGVYECIETDLNILVSKTINLIQKGGDYKGVKIFKELDDSIPVVKTDAERFRQVVFNVLKNAVEAVMDKEDGNIVVSTNRDGCSVRVVVADNGIGIHEEDLKKVFEPFFTTKPVGRGTGLGLSVSYGIMRDLKGDIKIESQIGKGTRVLLLLQIQ